MWYGWRLLVTCCGGLGDSLFAGHFKAAWTRGTRLPEDKHQLLMMALA